MCDLAPRNNFDLDAAVLHASMAFAGLFNVKTNSVFSASSTESRSTPALSPPDAPGAGAAVREGEGER